MNLFLHFFDAVVKEVGAHFTFNSDRIPDSYELELVAVDKYGQNYVLRTRFMGISGRISQAQFSSDENMSGLEKVEWV